MVIARLIGSFLCGAAISGVAAAAIAVYWLKTFDPKFRDAPSIAFEVEMWDLLLICIVATVVIGIVGFLLKNRLTASPSSLALCALWGVAYPLLLRLMLHALENAVGVEGIAVPVIGWAYLVGFPALAIVTILAAKSREKQHAL